MTHCPSCKSAVPAHALTYSFTCLSQTLLVIILLCFGLVTFATGFFLSDLLCSVPHTTDFSAWYGGYTLAVLLAVLALAGYAFHTSLGGQKLFTGKLLEGLLADGPC